MKGKAKFLSKHNVRYLHLSVGKMPTKSPLAETHLVLVKHFFLALLFLRALCHADNNLFVSKFVSVHELFVFTI